MAVSFNSIKAEVMSLLNALPATTPAIAQQNFTNASSGTVASVSTDWPEGLIQEAVIDSEYRICYEVGLNEFHPERADFEELSVALSNGATLPINSANSKPFVGKYSGIIDGTTLKPLIERPLAVVRMVTENEQSMYPAGLNVYAIMGSKLYFAAPNQAKITGPAVARATWAGNIRCRDSHAPAIVHGAMAYLLTKEGVWAQAFQMHAELYAAYLGAIRSVGRQTGVPMPGVQ
jgi:hypothetical protein